MPRRPVLKPPAFREPICNPPQGDSATLGALNEIGIVYLRCDVPAPDSTDHLLRPLSLPKPLFSETCWKGPGR